MKYFINNTNMSLMVWTHHQCFQTVNIPQIKGSTKKYMKLHVLHYLLWGGKILHDKR